VWATLVQMWQQGSDLVLTRSQTSIVIDTIIPIMLLPLSLSELLQVLWRPESAIQNNRNTSDLVELDLSSDRKRRGGLGMLGTSWSGKG
jgi:hypothetical protein